MACLLGFRLRAFWRFRAVVEDAGPKEGGEGMHEGVDEILFRNSDD